MRIEIRETTTTYINASADGCAQVGFVRPDSRFGISGFCSGDIIVSINGRDIKSYKDYKGYPFIVGRTYRFVLRSPLGLMHEASIEYAKQ